MVEGCWRHRYAKYADSPSTWERKGSVLGFFNPETRFQKSAFTGSMWTIGQNDAKHVRLHTKAFPCGWPLKCSERWWIEVLQQSMVLKMKPLKVQMWEWYQLEIGSSIIQNTQPVCQYKGVQNRMCGHRLSYKNSSCEKTFCFMLSGWNLTSNQRINMYILRPQLSVTVNNGSEISLNRWCRAPEVQTKESSQLCQAVRTLQSSSLCVLCCSKQEK